MVDRQTLPEDTFLDGSYRIVRVIGAGGFGITYEAVDIKLATRVAIKEYFPLEFGDRDSSQTVRPKSEATSHMFEWGRENFLTEARTLASFDHSSIVRVLRVFEANATAYMVMRFEKGQSFEEWLKSLGRLPTQRELDAIARPLLDALAELHSVNYLHRDIAPDNIVIRPDGAPVLLDFGSARHVVAEKSRAITGIVKAGYSPQEQYASDNKHQGPWTDIYALGGTLYRAVTGKRPLESMLRFDETSYEPAAVIARGRYRAPFLEAIDEALSVKPAERPQSVAVFREHLFRPEGPPTVIVPREEPQAGVSGTVPATVWPAALFASPNVQKGALAALVLIGALSGLKIAHHLELLPSALVARPSVVTSGEEAGARAAASEAKRLAALDADRIQRERAAKAEAERKRLADLEAERQRVEAEKKKAAEAEAARVRAEAEAKRLAALEAERQRVEAEKKKAAEAEAARLRAEAEAKRLAALEAERQRVEAEKKKAAEAEAARLRAEAEKKRLAALEAERQRVEAEKKKAAEAEAARLRAEAEKKRLADLEAERQRVEAERKKAAEAEAARVKAEAEKKRLADLEAERLKREATTPPVSRQDGGRQGLSDPRIGGGSGSDGGLEEFLASYRELLRSQQCNVANLSSSQLEKSVPAYIEAVNKLQNAKLEKIDFQSASRSTFNDWLAKAHARKSTACPFDPLGAPVPAPRPVVQPVQKAPPAYRPAPAAPRPAPQAPSGRTIMGIQ